MRSGRTIHELYVCRFWMPHIQGLIYKKNIWAEKKIDAGPDDKLGIFFIWPKVGLPFFDTLCIMPNTNLVVSRLAIFLVKSSRWQNFSRQSPWVICLIAKPMILITGKYCKFILCIPSANVLASSSHRRESMVGRDRFPDVTTLCLSNQRRPEDFDCLT